ncbi:hypothetical protein BACCAC_02528 [Bacteroides caccae ATCC 43185]|nr:hypothetical protein BACCAC_02528 [Bacteroides caccae ATCC 43185]
MIYRFDHSTFAFYIINAGDWEILHRINYFF